MRDSRQAAISGDQQSDEQRPSRRRYRRWVVALGTLLLGGAVLVMLLGLRGGQASELSEAQWNRLLQQMQRSFGDGDGAAGPPADGDLAPPAATTPSVPVTAQPQPPAGEVDASPTRAETPEARRLPPVELSPQIAARQLAEYEADRNKTIFELQPFRTTDSIDISDGGRRRGTATLINLNPRVNAWHLLRIAWEGEANARTYHLTNAAPRHQSLVLRPEFSLGIALASTQGSEPCDLWSHDNPRRLEAATARNTPYVMLCDDRVALRLKTTGHRTTVEKVTDFLRDTVWGGEALTVFVRETFYQDAFLSTSGLADPTNGDDTTAVEGAPPPARVAPEATGRRLERTDLGLSLDELPSTGQVIGAWYPLRDSPEVFASTMRAGLVHPDILSSHTGVVTALDEVEREALVYLAAFDLSAFDIAFSIGTDHPRLGWSERVPEEQRNARLSGPDGVDSPAPLVATGIITGALAGRSVATFTGGFKRTHGAFRYGELATMNKGSHYGFIEEGVVLSKLQPGLATIYVLADGTFDMKTWVPDDDASLARIRYARQNGVPIIERSERDGPGVPGFYVNRWGPGNWSGSQDGKYRTLRAGACLLETDSRRFLVYAYFSSATPSAMARVFQAYGCSYAMLLDMNALEHTYMAIYGVRGAELSVQHLVRGMEVLDKNEDGRLLPRFLGYADNRDFFYVLRRDVSMATPPEEDR